MRKHPSLKSWVGTITRKMPHLSKPQAKVLAMWSFGIAITQSSGLTTVSIFLAKLLNIKENTVRQRLREWLRDAEDKKGNQRKAIDVTSCFAPLLGWVLSQWQPGEKKLALAMDATTLGQRFTVLAISVLYRGCAIPVAWKIVKATSKGAWKPYWLELFTYIQNSVPTDWMVIVTADRGLYANWLYEKIVRLGWHPYLRVNTGGFFQSELHQEWTALSEVITEKGDSWCGRIRCFKKHSIDCTLLACWERGYAQPWLIVTDLAPPQANQGWYAMRSWIECSFKDTKRGGFSWHQTKTTDPVRAERQWLAIAVAMLWLIGVGGEDEVSSCHPNQPEHSEPETGSATYSSTSLPRKLSCFRRGFLSILVTLLWGQTLPLGHFYSFPWTDTFSFSSA